MTVHPENDAVPTPRPSATVVLLRDAPDGPEVLLGLRPERATFGASYVFPGGVRDPADLALDERAVAAEVANHCRRLGVAAGGLALFSAAIRELFEETGVLLARRANGTLPASLDTRRRQMNTGELGWDAFVAGEGLQLDCAALAYFAYWVTPRTRPKRWATRFFAAELPAGQLPRADGAELTEVRWFRPAAALLAAADGLLSLPAPTRATLRQLDGFDSAAAVCDWARQREAAGVRCTLPALLERDGRCRIVLPGDPDYPADHEGAEA